jgi:hypothetical protein
MTLPKSVRRTRRPGNYVLGRAVLSGKFSVPVNEPSADPDPSPDDDSGKDKAGEKKFTQADLNKIGAKQKAEGRAAAEKAVVDLLGCTPAEAAEIVKKHREAEDATKSEAEKEKAKASQAASAAEKAKADAEQAKHESLIERALLRSGFTADDSDEGQKKLTRVRKMITVEVGASFEDVLEDVKDVKADFPALFAEQQDPKDDGKKKPGKLPNSDPAGKPPAPKGGEDKYDAGRKRFEEQAKLHRGYNPLEKQQT